MNAVREMPKYQSHKEVWALKIKVIELSLETGRHSITPEEDGYAAFEVSVDYMAKHSPIPGGYYVVYEDGYKSFSPADAFDGGYSLIKPIEGKFTRKPITG